MNVNLFLKIARQIYKIAVKLPRIPLPQKIEKEALDCYYDFVNNDGVNGKKITKMINGQSINCTCYEITDIKNKCKNWQNCSLIRHRFDDKIIIYFYERKNLYNKTFTDLNCNIIVAVDYDYYDIIDIKHQLQHYFQLVILDQKKLQQYKKQALMFKNESEYLLSQSQRIQQIGSCCQKLFQLYMNGYYKQLTFEQFYDKKIENNIEINIEKLKSKRFEKKDLLCIIIFIFNKTK